MAFSLQKIVAYCKSHGFIYNGSSIYDGIQAVYDYGPYGILLKKNLQDLWWQTMTRIHNDIVGLDAAIFMAPDTWKASGHLENFQDWMVDNKDSKKRYRVDTLLESCAARWREEGKIKKAHVLEETMHTLLANHDGIGLTSLLKEHNIMCPIAQNTNWTSARQYNLMFSTQVGPIKAHDHTIYLRPETAQGIFVNFLQIQKATRKQLPFGVAQIGKAFRNEIVARQFIFRMREFEQMEMQFFVPPEEETKWFEHWVKTRYAWYHALGIPKDELRIEPHKNLAHYARKAVDITYAFPFGAKEVEGIHMRGDFDLRSHAKQSGKKLQYFDTKRNQTYIPCVIETSAGCDRLILMLLCHALKEEKKEDTYRTFLQIPPPLAPISAAVLPLLKKEPLTAQAQQIFEKLRPYFAVVYEANGSIGKRYSRQDLLGTPYCITIDFQTLEDDQVTIRDRDSMEQTRLPIDALYNYLVKKVALHTLLEKVAT